MAEASVPLSKIDRIMHYLMHEFEAYPYNDHKDPSYFSRLIDEFRNIDIEDELRQYHAWVLDQPDHKRIYYRSRFRSWLKTSQEFKRNPIRQTPHWLRRRHAQARRY